MRLDSEELRIRFHSEALPFQSRASNILFWIFFLWAMEANGPVLRRWLAIWHWCSRSPSSSPWTLRENLTARQFYPQEKNVKHKQVFFLSTPRWNGKAKYSESTTQQVLPVNLTQPSRSAWYPSWRARSCSLMSGSHIISSSESIISSSVITATIPSTLSLHHTSMLVISLLCLGSTCHQWKG